MTSVEVIENTNEIADNYVMSEDDQIAFLYLFKHIEQLEIAKQFGITQSRVSQVVSKYKLNEKYKDRLIRLWEKDISIALRGAASQTLTGYDHTKVPEGSKPQAIGIFIDKARLIDEQSTHNINVNQLSVTISAREAKLHELRKQLGMDNS